MKIVRIAACIGASVAVGALAFTFASPHPADAVTSPSSGSAGSSGCWITHYIDVVPTDPALPTSAAAALTQRSTQVSSFLQRALAEQDSVVANLESNALVGASTLSPDQASLAGFPAGSVVYVKRDATGKISATTQVEQVTQGHWAVTQQQVRLGADTDCSKNQLF